MPNESSFKWVGTRQIRPDGPDKVTGRAKYAADYTMPGMLIGRILRSPHAHARIKSIDTSKAEALAGVKAVVTSADFPELASEMSPNSEMVIDFSDVSNNVMARKKVMYDGHAVAAVAATDAEIAEEALSLIDVVYEVLPHVIDVEEAMAEDAPLLHDGMITEGITPTPTKPSNIAKRVEFRSGDVDKGFAEADVIVERTYKTAAVHQGYIEPHAVLASAAEDGQVQVWVSTQGQFMVRAFCAKVCGLAISQLRVTPAEIGGGFGGKTVVYGEPVAVQLSRKSGKPVRVVMSREEVLRASGPTSGGVVETKVGAKKDGTLVAVDAVLKYQAGAYAGSPIGPGCMCMTAPYEIENVQLIGYDVVSNRPKVAAYRAPGAPISAYAFESALDEVARELNMDPIAIREKNAVKEGSKTVYGVTFPRIGFEEVLEAAKNSDHFKSPVPEGEGRGLACGFWFNIGGESSAACHLNEDGTVTVISGNPDIGGSRASIALMVAETLGIDYNKVRPIVADTSSIGYNFVTGGSRVTFATGMAAINAAEDVIGQARERAAKIWEIDVDAVTWEDGEARPAGSNAGDHDPMSLADIAKMAPKTGGPINGHGSINAQGAGAGFGCHICDLKVDEGTGHVTVTRYTSIQDVGRAIHPGYVDGQLQGGAAQGIGWAINEEYVYNDDGLLQNAGFLDYRIPVASDLPMIDTVLVEVPNDRHPYGVRGVGEVPIVPPMAAVANAMESATGVRMTSLPMSPPKVLKALEGS